MKGQNNFHMSSITAHVISLTNKYFRESQSSVSSIIVSVILFSQDISDHRLLSESESLEYSLPLLKAYPNNPGAPCINFEAFEEDIRERAERRMNGPTDKSKIQTFLLSSIFYIRKNY